MTKQTRIILGALIIAGLFTIAWGPVFVPALMADFSPRLEAAYNLGDFAMHWLPIAVWFSKVGILAFAVYCIMLLYFLLRYG
jgi:hypothetical protein